MHGKNPPSATLADDPQEAAEAAQAGGSERPESILGLTIGKYRVDKKLGEGGMGAVYRMRHMEIPDTFLALKVLTLRAIPGDAVATREMAERFAQEARAASAVGSHRVVQVVDVGQLDDGTRYLMMEYVPGRSIGQAIAEDGPMDVRKALLLCARVADTLAIAHQRGIIHRDVKPMNLMLLDEGQDDDPMVKILDFGVSRATGEAKIAHTLERKVIGSPGYMAPEAAIGTPVDGRADVFSLAATLFEMVTGQLPFRGATFHALMMATIQDAIPPAGSVRPAHLSRVPDAVEAVLSWGLTKDPAQRPVMAEFRAALVEAAEAQAHAERRGTGPVLASVMRSFLPSPSERPTLSAGAAEASEILARYSTPAPDRAATPEPRGTPASGGPRSPAASSQPPRSREAVPAAIPAAVDLHSASARRVLADDAPPREGPHTVLMVSALIALLCLGVAAAAVFWPRHPAAPPPPAPAVVTPPEPTPARPTPPLSPTAPPTSPEPVPSPPRPGTIAALPHASRVAPPVAPAATPPAPSGAAKSRHHDGKKASGQPGSSAEKEILKEYD